MPGKISKRNVEIYVFHFGSGESNCFDSCMYIAVAPETSGASNPKTSRDLATAQVYTRVKPIKAKAKTFK